MQIKRLKPSKRGLTFSIEESRSFPVGGHFVYSVSKEGITIHPSEKGSTISRKKSGKNIKSLFDLRSRKVVEALANAKEIIVSFNEDSIIVDVIKHVSMQKHNANIVLQSKTLVHTKDIFHSTERLVIDRSMLSKVVGDEYPAYFEEQVSSITRFIDTESIITTDEQLRKVYKVVSLFSGAGMLDYSFAKDKDFKIVYANDYDQAACNSYQGNIGPIQHSSILDVSDNDIPFCDAIIGGLSCKPYSNENRHLRLLDHEDVNLIDEYLRITAAKRPQVFAIENVPSFITAFEGKNINKLVEQMQGYEISFKVVCDGSLGGYTKRKRAIIIGSRIGEVSIKDISLLPRKTVGEALAKVNKSWENYSDISKSKRDSIERFRCIPQGGNFRNVNELKDKDSHSNRMKRLSMDELAPSLANIRKSLILHPVYDRNISVSEAIALMGFDKDFSVKGTLGQKQQQVANGVPYAISNFIKKIIKRRLLNPLGAV